MSHYDDRGEPVDDDIDVLRDALCDVLRENARKDMAGRIYAAYVVRGAWSEDVAALWMDRAVREIDLLLSKLEKRK